MAPVVRHRCCPALYHNSGYMPVSKSNPMAQIERPGPVIVWEPQPWQAAFIACPVMEVFFGGARGGGKSDGVLGDWLMHADQYKENAIGLMVRRSRTELLETHERARVIYGKIGARFTYQPMRVVMPGGARLTFSYLDRDCGRRPISGRVIYKMLYRRSGKLPVPNTNNETDGHAKERRRRARRFAFDWEPGRPRTSMVPCPLYRPGPTWVESYYRPR